MSSLDSYRIIMVQAVCLCIINKSLSKDLEDDLIGLLRRNAYMFIYLGWLLYRWYPLDSKHDEHLP